MLTIMIHIAIMYMYVYTNVIIDTVFHENSYTSIIFRTPSVCQIHTVAELRWIFYSVNHYFSTKNISGRYTFEAAH